KLLLPLLAEVRRTDHGKALYLTPIEQFTGNESRFDGLADADIVGNQEPQGIELERHQQRHKLVSARLDRDVAEAAERNGSSAQFQTERIAKEKRCSLRARLARIGQIEARSDQIGRASCRERGQISVVGGHAERAGGGGVDERRAR